ncbi:thioredoxin domain-containing protein [Microbacterium esteraromaticum]|uniref:DsbA family protein n=1 Tax=Microbacterium esteraromaticum TaxID=57043 RepID=UPI0023689DAC|nr:thioredoxin domain-containing protein [Microbacterium esteraromaticum]WDH80068.1 thioredoxin domain-containing protein [Microbacterium esteraromaticum]
MTTARAPRTRRRILIIALAGVALIAVLLIASLTRPSQEEPDAAATAPTGQQTPSVEESEAPRVPDLSRRIDGDVAALGAVDAPVVMIEYADYRCPYCGVFALDTMPQLVADYIDTGKLRIEWRDVPLFGEDSFNAAVAARAAGQQGLFWEYHHAVYAFQGDSRKDLPREQLLELADEAGVPDLAAFETALDDPALQQAVAADAQEAQAIGVQSTPAFLIGQTPVMGAQPIDVFRQVIDGELARVGE